MNKHILIAALRILGNTCSIKPKCNNFRDIISKLVFERKAEEIAAVK